MHAPTTRNAAARAWRQPRAPGLVQGFWALYRRELRRQARAVAFLIVPQGLTAALLIAVFDLAAPQGLGGQMQGLDAPLSLGAFIAPGLVAIAVLNIAFQTTAFTILHAKIDGYIDIELMAPLPVGSRLLAHALMGATMGLLVGLVVAAVLVPLIGLRVADAGQAILFAALGAWCIALFGIFAGLWARKWDSLSAIATFIVTPLVFLSGAFAPVSGFADPFAAVVAHQPFHFVIDGVRGGLSGFQDGSAWIGAVALAAIGAAGAFAVSRLIRTGYHTVA
ncbi:MAG: ABC transporter permease [Alphaproteobacteria bacterium]